MVSADSALYSQGNLFLIKDLKWITRVPLSIKAAQLYVREIPNSELVKTEIEGYKVVEKKSNYGGVEQKWLVVESQERKKSDLKKLEKKVKKDSTKAQEILTSLGREKFTSITEAKTIIKSEQKKLKYHVLQLIELVKTQDNKTQKTIYKAQVSLAKNLEQIEAQSQRAGRFILGTNLLKSQELTTSEIIRKYKEQQAPERGFAFLKDPLFFADSIFLKSPERVETLGMLMSLALLVYTIGQRQLRLNLKTDNKALKNQVGKLTDRPTLRWIFQCFQGIHLVILDGVKQIVNLTDSRTETLSFFSKECQKYYILSG